MVNSTIKELRKEAYKMWGIQPKSVVYNMPNNTLKPHQDFVFQINYSDGFEEWPKSYTLMVQNVCNLDRIIMPVIIVNRHLDTSRHAWYDMPQSLNDQIIQLVEGNPIKRKLSLWKHAMNYFLPATLQYREHLRIEEYTFCVTRNENNSFSVKLV